MLLKELRQKKNLTLKQVATLVGVAESTVCLWEKGCRRPALEKMFILAEIFKTPVVKILECFKG